MHHLRNTRFPANAGLALAILALLLGLASGCAREEEKGLGEDFWEKYDDVTDWVTLKLNLTPEQEDTVLPILQENFRRKKEMLKGYGFLSGEPPELTQKQREEIDAKMIAIRAETRAQLVDILDEQQLQSLKELQLEYHEEFRRRLAEM
ncbi:MULTISPECIES: hypothetical protein [Microbulbifer]|uniref:hypothetical protein n=1 Tax=Microbulbifer TaxID=48073 RepID=UPI001E6329E4|nr:MULTISPECIES: hypothetical protein [Microbulbifer]UHQ56623.1 hypothetical protein LVE68_06550 [Microbulbifer sp. YPW16]